MEPKEIEEQLDGFTGTQNWYSLKPLSELTFTDGVKAMADMCQASWFVTDVSAVCDYEDKVKGQPFVVVELKRVEGDKFVVVYSDGNDNEIYRQEYAYSDFPLDKMKLYVTDGVILLPGEY